MTHPAVQVDDLMKALEIERVEIRDDNGLYDAMVVAPSSVRELLTRLLSEHAAALLQAQTRTQELEPERDELSVTIKRLYRDVPLLLDQLTAARAEIARLEAQLRPFQAKPDAPPT